MPLKKIFFSYSRQDGSEFSLRLATDLKKYGFNIWIDQQDIRAGTEWDLEVEKALETCDCLLFIETQKSVVSNNVLDEVYYALGQNKIVIPLIVVDSKTPFRIQRIQHVDFTSDYDSGLKRLIKELQNAEQNTFAENVQLTSPSKTGFKKYRKWLFAAASAIVVIAVLWYNTAHHQTLVTDTKIANDERIIAEGDKDVNNGTTIGVNKIATVRAAKKLLNAKENKKNTPSEDKQEKKLVKMSDIDIPSLAGEWVLKDINFKTRLSDGYLKIEPVVDSKYTIKSSLRFFYIKPKDTAYLSIFNAFVGCTNCSMQQEIKLMVEDIAIGSQVYSILKHNQEGVGKAGDTIMDKGANKSIRGMAELKFIDNKTALIKISRATPVELEAGLVLNPFTYLFTFKKVD